MKNLLLFLFIIGSSIIFSTCSNDEDSIINPPQPTIISGKIENWHYGSDMKLLVTAIAPDTLGDHVYLDTAVISSDGNFTFALTTPPDNLFRKFETDSACLSIVQIQPPEARWIFMQLNVHADTGKFGEIERSSDSLEFYWGQTRGYYAYFNTAGTLTGQDSCVDTLTTSVRKYNVSFPARSWFSIYAKFEQITSTHFRINVSSQSTDQLKWYFIRREEN